MVALVYANVSWLLFELINNDAVAILIIRSNSFASFHSVFLLYSPNAIKHCFTLWMRCSTLQSLLPVQCTVYMYSTRTFSQFVNMYIQAIIFTLATVVWEYVCIYSPVIRCLSVFIFIKCNKFMKKKHKHMWRSELNAHKFNTEIFGCYINIVGLLNQSLTMMDLSSVFKKSST